MWQRSTNQRFSALRSGVSLLIALTLISGMIVLGIVVSTIVVSSTRQAANMNRANEAYYVAEGGLELGLLENKNHGPGYNGPEQTLTYSSCDTVRNPTCGHGPELKSSYRVEGQVPSAGIYGPQSGYAGMYGIPTPGTGDVGSTCNPLKAVTDGSFPYDGQTYSEPADQPCNWNKIKVGETVTIPLYSTDSNGNIVNLFDAGNANNAHFVLRLRTACKDDKVMCASLDRPDLDFLTTGDPKTMHNDPIVDWAITAKDAKTGNKYSLGPWIVFDPKNGFSNVSTIITERIISVISKTLPAFEAIQEISQGVDLNECRGKILDFLLSRPALFCSDPAHNWDRQTLETPTLTFTVIHGLEDTDGDTVPSLEYQLLIKAGTRPPTDAVQRIVSEGLSGDFKQRLEVQISQEGGISRYTLQQ